MKFTAKISRNLKDIETGAPKVLLRGIMTEEDEFRDHAWVELNRELDKLLKHRKEFQRNKGNGSAIIEFEADIKNYMYRETIYKQTLKNIKTIRVLGKA